MDELWTTISAFQDRPSAEATRELLGAEGVPCFIASNEFVPGLGSNFELRVPSALAQRARGLLEQTPISDSELNALAVGSNGQDPDGG